MLLKRKRSSSEFSSSTSSTASSSPPQNRTFNFNFTTGDAFGARTATMSSSPSHLNSRTMKRLRNGRPSEEEVHQRTLNILYSAQRQLPESDLPMSSVEDETPEEQHISPEPARNQHSLHRFWNIKSTPRPMPGFLDITEQPAQCTQCLTGSANSNGYSDSMDVDMSGESRACGACGRQV